jgi:methionyl-tRNA synthetase
LPVPAEPAGRLAQAAASAVASYREAMDRFALQDGMAAAYSLIDAANLYITETEPWKLAKDEANAPRVAQILYEVAEALRIAAVLLLPAIPASAAEILRRVGAPKAGTGHRLDDAAWGAGGDLVTIKAESMWPRIGGTKGS